MVEDADSPVLREAIQLIEQETTERMLASRPPHHLADFSNLPSAVIKEIRDDDAYFINAYETLIGILDHRMEFEEKAAIWTVILYLKSVEAYRWDVANELSSTGRERGLDAKENI